MRISEPLAATRTLLFEKSDGGRIYQDEHEWNMVWEYNVSEFDASIRDYLYRSNLIVTKTQSVTGLPLPVISPQTFS